MPILTCGKSLVAQADDAAKKSLAAPATEKTGEKATGDAKELQRQLLDLGLPIGWSLTPAPQGKPEGINVNEYRTPPDWLLLMGMNGKKSTSVEDKKGTSVEDKKGTSVEDKKGTSVEDKKGTSEAGKESTAKKDPKSTSEEWKDLLRTIRFHGFGWLISIIAASLGAPFWFDLLNKFMNIRSAGKPPAKQAAAPAPSA